MHHGPAPPSIAWPRLECRNHSLASRGYPSVNTVKSPAGSSFQTFFRRLQGAREADLFGPRGRLPQRGEPDTSRKTALLVLAVLIVAGLALRLAVTRGIWLDEAITIHQAHLSLR